MPDFTPTKKEQDSCARRALGCDVWLRQISEACREGNAAHVGENMYMLLDHLSWIASTFASGSPASSALQSAARAHCKQYRMD